MKSNILRKNSNVYSISIEKLKINDNESFKENPIKINKKNYHDQDLNILEYEKQ